MLCWCQSVSATVTAVSEASVSAVVSVTAVTELTVTAHFRLWPKLEKVVSVGLYFIYQLLSVIFCCVYYMWLSC